MMRKDVYKMFEIKGKVMTAICYAKVVEDEAIEQIRRMCDYDLTRDSKVRIMPDVHAGIQLNNTSADGFWLTTQRAKR